MSRKFLEMDKSSISITRYSITFKHSNALNVRQLILHYHEVKIRYYITKLEVVTEDILSYDILDSFTVF